MPKVKHWYDILRDTILSVIDNWAATPFNNIQFILDLQHYQNCSNMDTAYSYFDAESPYPNVNHSTNAPLIKGSIFLIAVFGIFFSFFITRYRKLRRQEGISHYFFFENLFQIGISSEIGASEAFSVPFEYLHAAAFFYNPDLPHFVCWIRRIWAYVTGKNAIRDLEKYLNDKKIEENKSKKMLLESMYKEINERIAAFVTKQKKYGDWEAKETLDGNWSIKPSDDSYFEDWLRRRRTQNSCVNNKNLDGKNFFLLIFNFFSSLPLLDGLGRASFVYWIVYFIFLFLPGVCLAGVTVVAWPPIAVAFAFVFVFWATKIYHRFSQKKNTSDVESTRQNEIKWLTEAVKHQILLDGLLKENFHNLNYNKVKFRARLENDSSKYKESKLCKEIRASLKNKKDFILVRAVFKGFIIEGCFPIFFISWLLISALGLVLTLNCAVVALITLGLGIVYGIYSAINRYRRDMEALFYLEEKFLKIQEKCGDIEIPDISLTECDRLFRRGKVNATSWTAMKQLGNRIFVGFITFGTGVLFLKLLPLGITMAVLKGIIYAGLSITIVPTFFPMLGVMLAGGLFFACVLVFLYHHDQKGQKAGRVLDFICNRPYNLDTDLALSPSVIGESNNEVSALPGSQSPLDGSERAFHLLSYEGNRFPPQPERSQIAFLNRRNLLRKWSKSELSLEEKNKIWKSNGEIISLKNENQTLRRKRSNTLPPNVGKDMKKQAIDSKGIALLKEFKQAKNTAMFASQKTNLNGPQNSQEQPDSQMTLGGRNCLRVWPIPKFSLQKKHKTCKNNSKVIKLNNGKKILKRSNTLPSNFGNGTRKKMTYLKVKALFKELKQTKNTVMFDSQLNESQSSHKARVF